nr:MAG TPA: hypothetical protein [Caudoviricetes sp.]
MFCTFLLTFKIRRDYRIYMVTYILKLLICLDRFNI